MRVAVFCHFDIHSVVDDYVLYALRSYRQYFDYICFVSSSDLDYYQVTRANLYSDAIICKDNLGYDFLSWRAGFEALNLRQCEEITFINDSCYGPCRDIGLMFEIAENMEADLWGASLSRQVRPHVQSFFMTFRSPLLRSGFARTFWDSVGVIPNKQDLIYRYEVGLSALVEESGFKIAGVVDLAKISRSTREIVCEENQPTDLKSDWAGTRKYILEENFPNPSQLYWGEMLRGGSPLLKLENFRSNPMGSNLSSIFSRLEKDRWYDKNLILNHLQRVLDPERFAYVLSQSTIHKKA